jgi:hypothetical protein
MYSVQLNVRDVGAGDRSRTGDLAITNRTLYQLSYAGLSMHLTIRMR